ncbi:hypothetical protein BC938DRAFT_480557, partial [Jimgerdemannia flammicorona]
MAESCMCVNAYFLSPKIGLNHYAYTFTTRKLVTDTTDNKGQHSSERNVPFSFLFFLFFSCCLKTCFIRNMSWQRDCAN